MEKFEAAYVRVSTEEQKKYGHGADAQQYALERYFSNNNIILSEDMWFIDEGYTGVIKDRPEFIRLRKFISEGKIKKIYVTSTDRLSRNIAFREDFFNYLQEKGIEIVPLYDYFDWSTAYGRQQNRSKAVYDQAESELASERTKKALDESARQGNYTYAIPPIGYKRVVPLHLKDKRIEIDYSKSEIVVWIFEKIASKEYNPNRMAKHLRKNKILGKKWNSSMVTDLLNNPIYIGTFSTKRQIIENHSPALISVDLWNRTQDALKFRSKHHKHKYPFSNIITCEFCGNTMQCDSTFKPKSGIRYYYYVCKQCNKRVNENKIHSVVAEYINELILEDESIGLPLELKTKIKSLDAKLRSLDSRLEAGIMAVDEYTLETENTILKMRGIQYQIESILKEKKLLWRECDTQGKKFILDHYLVTIRYNHQTKVINVNSPSKD